MSASVASVYNVFIAGLTLPYFFIYALILLGFDINPCYVCYQVELYDMLFFDASY